MEIKEAIEFVSEIKHSGNGYGNSYISDFNKLKDIISLLKRLEKYEKREVISELLVDENEKYKQIFEEITTNGYFSSIDTKYLKDLEQKYFPKGV